MTILGLLITLILIGVVLYLINHLIPMDGKIRTIINVVVVLVVLLWLMDVFVLDLGTVPVIRARR